MILEAIFATVMVVAATALVATYYHCSSVEA